MLNDLDLSANQLTGAIPPEIANCIQLGSLFLNDNQFTGRMPQAICDLNHSANGDLCFECFYDTFDVRRNKICPPYPSCFEVFHMEEQDSSACM